METAANLRANTAAQAKGASGRSLHQIARCILAAAFLTIVAQPATAADACKVLLCLAAPSWRSIPECVPAVRRVLRDIARGKPFPLCPMSGAGNAAQHDWAFAPTYCPPQYSRAHETEGSVIHTCDYAGAVTVTISGSFFTRTWWTPEGDSVTEFSAAAKAQLGRWDTRFDDEYAAWLAALPPPAAPVVAGH